MLDYASSRISVDDENTNTDSEIETITIVIALLNIGLLIVLIYNISEGRKEKALLEKAGRRAERLKVNSKKAQLLENDKNNLEQAFGAGSDTEDDIEDLIDYSITEKCVRYGLDAVKCKCFRGATNYNIMELVSIALVMVENILSFTYKQNVKQVW